MDIDYQVQKNMKDKDFKKIPIQQDFGKEKREKILTNDTWKCPKCKWFVSKKSKECPLCSL